MNGRDHLSLSQEQGTVLFVTSTGEYGGAEKHLLELLQRLTRVGVRSTVLCLDQDFYSGRLSKDDVSKISVISCESKPDSFLEWYRLFRAIRPRAVVFVRAWLWCYKWYVPIAAWIARIPRRISIAHLPPVPVRQRVRRFLGLPKLLISAYFQNVIICVSDAIRHCLTKEYRFPKAKTVTVRNGITLSEFEHLEGAGEKVRTRLGVGADEFLLVCVARLNEQKRIDVLLSAMAKLRKTGQRCKCVIVGDGPLRKVLTEKAVALGLTGDVFFEGFQSDTRSYLKAGTAFVLTSDYEGLPLAILEAMACGLPCIVTNVGGNPEVVEGHVNGLLIPPGSADEVAATVSFLLTNPGKLREMSEMAKKTSRTKFDIEICMNTIVGIILNKTQII